MAPSIISSRISNFGGADIGLWKVPGVLHGGVVVPLLRGIKAAIHYFGIEFLDLRSLLTSGIGGAIFIIGFLLSSILISGALRERYCKTRNSNINCARQP